MPHTRMSHVTRTSKSCDTYEWVIVTRANESCHSHEWVMAQVMAHIRISHVTYECCIWGLAIRDCDMVWHIDEMSRIDELLSHVWTSHGTHPNKSRHLWMHSQGLTIRSDMMSRIDDMSRINELLSHVRISHATHTNESVSNICEYVIRLIRDMTRAYLMGNRADVPWRIHMCDVTRLFRWHAAFIRVTWLAYTWRDLLIRGVTNLCVTWVTYGIVYSYMT